jgi:Neuraminidase (sialidase)
MVADKNGTLYAFTKERPPAGAAAGPAQDPLPLPPGPANTCKAASSAPNAPAWKPTPPTSAPPVPGKPGAGARLLMSKSTDDGKTWVASVVDTSGVVCVPCLTTPEAALDPRTGAIYLAFEQSDLGPPGPRDDRDIWFMRSSDGGKTWTKKTRLNDDSTPSRNPNYDQMFPGISVAPNGRIDVAWWDFRTDAIYNSSGNGNTTRRDETCFDIFYTSSSDGGKTWATNSRISDRTMNQNEGYAMNLAYDLRGPVGITSTDAAAYVSWSDSRNGRVDLPTEDVYLGSVVYAEPRKETSGVKAGSVFLGVAIGAVVAGLVFLVAARGLRRGPAPTG